MKKYFYTVLALSVAALVSSCNKEKPELDNNSEKSLGEETVSVVVEDDISTKGHYVIGASNAVYSWDNGDQFMRIIRTYNGSTYGTYSYIPYEYVSGSGNTAVFSGESVGEGYVDSGFALFPKNIISYTYTEHDYDFMLNMPETVVYDPANPIKNVIPMFGERKLVGSAYTYVFKPLTGVIAVKIKNIPSNATSVSLSSTGKGLSGNSDRFNNQNNNSFLTGVPGFLGENTVGLKKSWMKNGSSKTYSFEPGCLDNETYNDEATFYFPIATSDASGESAYSDFTVTIKEGSTTLASIEATGLAIRIARNELIQLPTIDASRYTNNAVVALTGDASDIKAYISGSKGSVSSVRVAPIATNSIEAINAAIPNNTTGTEVISATTEGSAVSIMDGVSSSGKYYIGYKAFNGETELFTYIRPMPVYYITPTDKNSIVSQYQRQTGPGTSKGNTAGNAETYDSNLITNGANTITIKESNDFTKGNVMITEFCGICYDVSESVMPHENYADGTPVYGIYNASGSPQASFTVSSAYPFYLDGEATPRKHWVSTCSVGTNKLSFNFNSSVGGTSYDLVCTNDFIGDSYNTWFGGTDVNTTPHTVGGYVIYYDGRNNKNYVANKKQ